MSDLRTMMFEAVGSVPATTDLALADADVARARQARRRHRVVRLSAGSGLALTAAVVSAVLVASPTTSRTGPSAGVGAPSAGATAGATATSATVRLVSYTGEQPAGYTLDRVPEGWTVMTSNRGVLTLAPEGATDDSGLPAGLVSNVDRIAISQDDAVPSGVATDEIEVDGRPGVIAHLLGADGKPDGTRTLFLRQPSGVNLSIQVWNGIGWSNAQIAEFASGVHVTKDATVSVG